MAPLGVALDDAVDVDGTLADPEGLVALAADGAGSLALLDNALDVGDAVAVPPEPIPLDATGVALDDAVAVPPVLDGAGTE